MGPKNDGHFFALGTFLLLETAKEVRTKLEGLTDDVLSQFVDEAKYSRIEDAHYMKQALIQRRDTVIKGLEKITTIE